MSFWFNQLRNLFTYFWFVFSVLPGSAMSAAVPALGLNPIIPALKSCRELILVTAPNWETPNAIVRLYERSTGEITPWREIRGPIPAIIGQRGLAWGNGLHGIGAPGEPLKREGDLKSPAGIFRLTSVFGIAGSEQAAFVRLPYRQVTSSTEAIDDPNSKYYNQIVDRSSISNPDWSSSESMLQVGGRYRFGIMIEHNPAAVPGRGSCIFLHVWDKRYPATAGCTAVPLNDLTNILHWVDGKANPLIVQLPVSEYLRLKSRWGLP
jgi:L,D-peptidoglycan transpeptidase YkuD (ErfK/YbiS/YcfS/YnhG family)